MSENFPPDKFEFRHHLSAKGPSVVEPVLGEAVCARDEACPPGLRILETEFPDGSLLQ